MSSTEGLSDASSDDTGVGSTREDFSLGGTGEADEGGSSSSRENDDAAAVAVARPPRSLSRPSEQELTLTGSTALDELDQVRARRGPREASPRAITVASTPATDSLHVATYLAIATQP